VTISRRIDVMRSSKVSVRFAVAALAVAALGLSSCSDDSSGETTTPAGDATTTVAVADDGTATTLADEPALDFEEAGGDVRGFDGTTIRLASIGIKSQLPGTEVGVRARIKRFNDTNEVPGVKLEYVEFVEDKADPAIALSEARRLVTSENVFAIVGDVSAVNPGEYFEQQEVPYFGYAFDFTYCSEEPDPDIWGFGFNGCLVPADPKELPDAARHLYNYMTEKTGKDAPAATLFSGDNTSGKNTVKFQEILYDSTGFDVVFSKAILPTPPIADYTPYVQDLLTSNSGSQPDVIICLAAADCIPIYTQLVESGYDGVFHHTLYSDLLVGLMKGTTASTFAVPFSTEGVPALDQVKADIVAVKADQTLETGSAAGYFSTDMFIQALETVAAKGTDFISPANVRLAAAHQTWKIEGLIGPTRYPDSTVTGTPNCNALVTSDGTTWQTVAAYDCSDKRFPITG
jgi:ABC-type branched-subunit amino acid transport system substrate-binding protein